MTASRSRSRKSTPSQILHRLFTMRPSRKRCDTIMFLPEGVFFPEGVFLAEGACRNRALLHTSSDLTGFPRRPCAS